MAKVDLTFTRTVLLGSLYRSRLATTPTKTNDKKNEFTAYAHGPIYAIILHHPIRNTGMAAP